MDDLAESVSLLQAGRLTRRQFLRRCAALGITAATASWLARGSLPASAASQLKGPVNFLTWSDHFDAEELKDFFALNGVKINTIEFAENADALTKVKLQGGKQIDLVAADPLWVPKYNELGLIEPLDLKSWPVYDELYDEFKQVPIWKVGDKSMGLPWGWAPILIYYNPKYVTGNPTGWDVLWDSKFRKRYAAERQPTDLLAMMGIATGAKKPYAMTAAELASAKDGLRKLKPNILKFVQQSVELVKMFTDETIWIATATMGMDWRVKEAGGPALKALFPREGYVGFLDADCLVKNAAHREAAIAWLQHKSQAKYAAINFLAQFRPLTNKKAFDLLVKQGKGDLARAFFYDKPEIAQKMILKGPPPNLGAYIDAFNEAIGS